MEKLGGHIELPVLHHLLKPGVFYLELDERFGNLQFLFL
jgi:hypothetical protein